MIVDAIILLTCGFFLFMGLWLLWVATADAWDQWRRGE